MPYPLPDDVRAALASGRKIDAIRLLRERTGLGLAQAKAAVEAGAVPDDAALQAPSQHPQGLAGAMPAEVQAALATGNLLQAIKLLRQSKGVGLKQAKAMADEARQAVAPQAGQASEGPSPGEVPRSTLSPGFVALVIVLAVAAWLLLGL